MLVVTRNIARFDRTFLTNFKKFMSAIEFNNTCRVCTRGYTLVNNSNFYYKKDKNINKLYSNITHHTIEDPNPNLDTAKYEKISSETLESLADYFDHLIEEASHLQDADVSHGDGVLTVKFGGDYGTYVINRQVPNKQIWLSSPTSGPKRYDFISNTWIYKHNGESMHELLTEEIPKIVKMPVTFDKCSFGVRKS